jgi:hypothetical protein
MKHETAYYKQVEVALVAHFGGPFHRWQDESWGKPDFFGSDRGGRLHYVEVKLADRDLRPLQKDFFETEWAAKQGRLWPGLWVLRIFESDPRSTTQWRYARLYAWTPGGEIAQKGEFDLS